jgi:hypothetical protein
MPAVLVTINGRIEIYVCEFASLLLLAEPTSRSIQHGNPQRYARFGGACLPTERG